MKLQNYKEKKENEKAKYQKGMIDILSWLDYDKDYKNLLLNIINNSVRSNQYNNEYHISGVHQDNLNIILHSSIIGEFGLIKIKRSDRKLEKFLVWLDPILNDIIKSESKH